MTFRMVRGRGVEPLHLSVPDPKCEFVVSVGGFDGNPRQRQRREARCEASEPDSAGNSETRQETYPRRTDFEPGTTQLPASGRRPAACAGRSWRARKRPGASQGHGGIGRGRPTAPGALGLFTLALLATGCAGCASGLRGDGSLAVLEISDKLHQLRYEPTITTYGFGDKAWSVSHPGGDMVDAFCAGAHLWDVVGAQVRCRREVEGQHAVSSIGVVLADGWENPGAAAWWSIVDDKIHVAHMQWGEADGAAAAAAHEIGHAMGLGHLGGYDLMHTEIRSNTLTDDDKAAFQRVWH
jgi:hypothetical protein